MKFNYEVGDIVKLKKQHPCGSREWEILRVGADFRLKCTGCGQKSCGKKYQRIEKKGLNISWSYVKISNRDILFQDRKVFPDTFCDPCSLGNSGGQKTKRRYNKHEQIRISISC